MLVHGFTVAVITPAAVFELVTGACTITPARTASFSWRANVPGSNRAAVIVMLVFAAAAVVLMAPGLFMMKPDGSTVMVCVFDAKVRLQSPEPT
jgi:hypothetical protein